MSKEAVQKVIGRAIADEAFRNLLLSNPDQALAGFELTVDEVVALKGIERETLSAGAAELDARVSKAAVAIFAKLGDIKGESLD